MNANLLYQSEHYAWTSYRQRGVFPLKCEKVKLLSMRRQRQRGNDNATTFAEIETESGRIISVVTRELIDFWDNYESERDHILEERAKKQAAQTAQVERANKIHDYTQMLAAKKGLPLHQIRLHSYNVDISIPAEDFYNWLGVSKDEIAATVDGNITNDSVQSSPSRGNLRAVGD